MRRRTMRTRAGWAIAQASVASSSAEASEGRGSRLVSSQQAVVFDFGFAIVSVVLDHTDADVGDNP